MFRLFNRAAVAAVFVAFETSAFAQVGYVGGGGSWTYQACVDLFGEKALVPITREDYLKAFNINDEQLKAFGAGGKTGRKFENICVPVTTAIVGVTPYMDEVLDLTDVTIVAEYPKMLGYSLLVKPGMTLKDIKTVYAHPVAIVEAKPWLDKEMLSIPRKARENESVADITENGGAILWPPIAARIYGLEAIVNGIEEGPHNVTRWWVLGHKMPAPTGNDKSTLVLSVTEADFAKALQAIVTSSIRVLTIYERPTKKTLDTHRYVIDVVGHAQQEPLKKFLAENKGFRLLGSYPRKY